MVVPLVNLEELPQSGAEDGAHEDEDKRKLMSALETLAREMGETVEVTNPERELELIYNGRKFKITLSAPRGSNKKD